jgi:hypothetical protein
LVCWYMMIHVGTVLMQSAYMYICMYIYIYMTSLSSCTVHFGLPKRSLSVSVNKRCSLRGEVLIQSFYPWTTGAKFTCQVPKWCLTFSTC